MKRKIKEILSVGRGPAKNAVLQLMQKSVVLLLIIFCSSSVYAQNARTVTGSVVDIKGDPVIGAAVVVKDNITEGVITDINGKFSLRVSANAKTLMISYIGMLSQEVSITGKNDVTITMETDNVNLDEVVVVGYGQQKKVNVVGAISQTTGAVLQRAGGVSSIGAALTGNLPGVVTTSSTGMPGEEDPRIVIRGASTWNGNDPLVLVDGIERPINSVEINSVESISVLKDASATAVFGVKGANGVIIITTKRGSEGRANVDIGVSSTLKAPSKLPGKYDSYDALRIRNMAIERELGLSPDSWDGITPQEILDKYRHPADQAERDRYPNVDWGDALFKDFASSYNAYVNIAGGTETVKYFTALDYLNEGDLYKSFNNQKGYKPGYGFNRINVRSNLDFKLTKTTTLSANLSGSYGMKKGPVTGFEYTMWASVYGTPPDVFWPKYSDGTWGGDPLDTQIHNSARSLANAGNNTTTTARVNTDFTLTQDLSMLLKGLSVKGTISWDNTFVERDRGILDNSTTQSKKVDPETGEVMWEHKNDSFGFDFQQAKNWSTRGGSLNADETYRKLYYQLQLNYGATFGKHEVTAMGLFSREEVAKGNSVPNHREDWVFRTTYNFNKKYILEYNGAYNGSDKFGPKHRFDFFNSGGASWIISEESFMKNVKFVDLLKLKGSIGQVGDDNIWGIDPWLYMTRWEYGGNSLMTEVNDRSPYTWYREKTVGNPDVHWETVIKSNAGLEFSFLNGLVAGSVEYFRDKRSNILIRGTDRAIPFYYGASQPPTKNIGKVKVNGVEIELRFNHVFKNGMRLWANTNITHSKDKILKHDDPNLLPYYQKKIGKQIGQTYSYVNSGYYNTWDELYGSTEHSKSDNQKLPGGYNILDYNGDGIIDADDNIPYAYPERPQNTYNLNLGFEWKGFSAFVQFYGVSNVTRQVVFNSFPRTTLNTVYDQGSYWSKDNTNADVPLPRWRSTPMGESYGNMHMYDGSYIRLKNAEISYTWNSGWIKKVGISKLRVYLNGNNLWVWTKMPDDREANFAGTGWASQGAYPTVKRFNLGVQITL